MTHPFKWTQVSQFWHDIIYHYVTIKAQSIQSQVLFHFKQNLVSGYQSMSRLGNIIYKGFTNMLLMYVSYVLVRS